MSKHTPEPWVIWNGVDGIMMYGAREPKLLMGYEKARLGLETQRSQTEGVIPILTAGTDG